uniref:Protein TsetseEP domain-containing protein n=1 Tax=Anopheles dirus TaxID=7168 RepID=A0A182NTS5_9DIPT
MRSWFVLLLGALSVQQCVAANDPQKELEVCDVNLFSLINTRLQQQILEYMACQQSGGGSCRGSIERATVDIQQGIVNFLYCTKDIRTDARAELIACSTTLFQLAAYRLTRQLEEFAECQRLNVGVADRDCRDSIQRSVVDMQQGLIDYIQCTNDIA